VYNDCWKDNWAFIYEDGIAPLLIGEWGGYMDGGPNEKWMTAIRDYIAENRIHHTFWCYNANSGDTGGLVTHDFITWEEDKYELLKPTLWQHNGKFVSLDHKVPLGSNGISLSEVNGEVIPTPTKPNIPTPTPSLPKTLIYGDLNNDESFDSIDFGLLRLLLLGYAPQTEINKEAADVDGNGQVDAIDFALMRQYLLGIIDKFPIER
jgi:endoglucanase